MGRVVKWGLRIFTAGWTCLDFRKNTKISSECSVLTSIRLQSSLNFLASFVGGYKRQAGPRRGLVTLPQPRHFGIILDGHNTLLVNRSLEIVGSVLLGMAKALSPNRAPNIEPNLQGRL